MQFPVLAGMELDNQEKSFKATKILTIKWKIWFGNYNNINDVKYMK